MEINSQSAGFFYNRAVKKISEQQEAHAVEMHMRGVPYEEIAAAIGFTPWQTKRCVEAALRRAPELLYPGLDGLSPRALNRMMLLNLGTKEAVARFIRTGLACRYEGIGPVVLAELCAWTGVKLIEEPKAGSYWVEGQMNPDELIDELRSKIWNAERNIDRWKTELARLKASVPPMGGRTRYLPD